MLPTRAVVYRLQLNSKPRSVPSNFLLAWAILPIVLIPIENNFTIAGWSIAKLAILPLLTGVVLTCPSRWLSIWKHPLFLGGITFLLWGALCEALHVNSDWEIHFRVLQTFVFASLVAVVLWDRSAFQQTLLAFALVCLVLSLYLILNFYGAVNISGADFKTANRLRMQAFEGMWLESNLNILGLTVGMGAIIALAKLLAARKNWQRVLWGLAYLICALGATVPLSRGAFLAIAGSSALVLWRSLKRSLSTGKLLLALSMMILLFTLMPEALTARLSLFERETVVSNKEDSRVKVYTKALDAAPQFWALGVGSGNYWREWGVNNGFGSPTPWGMFVTGPHNSFIAAWMYFGLPGLILLCLMCFVAARQFRASQDASWEANALFGLMVLGLVWLMVTHNLYLKQFGLIISLIVGASTGALRARPLLVRPRPAQVWAVSNKPVPNLRERVSGASQK